MAFVFLNRYLDITEAIEAGDAGMIDNSDFVGTAHRFGLCLPVLCVDEPCNCGFYVHSHGHSLAVRLSASIKAVLAGGQARRGTLV